MAIRTSPGALTVARLEPAPIGLVLTARLRDNDQVLAGAVIVAPKLDRDGEPLHAYTAEFTAPDSLPVEIEWREGAATVATETIEAWPDPIGAAAEGYTPIVADVGNMLARRTKDDDGNELGTFTDATTPTDNQVQSLIIEALYEVTGQLGDTIPTRLHRSVKTAILLLTAMNIESTYYPEQVSTERSAYPLYERRYNAMLGTPSKPGWLVSSVVDEETGGPEGPDDEHLPLYFFGDAAEVANCVWDPVTETWTLRAPPPSADEGSVLGQWI